MRKIDEIIKLIEKMGDKKTEEKPNQGTCIEQDDVPTVTAGTFSCGNWKEIKDGR